MIRKETRDDIKEEKPRNTTDEESDLYSEEGREELLNEDDEITEVDEGFMKGYDEGEKSSDCINCGKVLERDIVEEELDGEVLRFCNEECAFEYSQKKDEDD